MTLLNRVERYLRRSGVTAAGFGRASIGDPGLVRDLRNGREPKARTEARILAFIEAAERAVEEARRCDG